MIAKPPEEIGTGIFVELVQEPPPLFTARVIGWPELHTTAESREEAVEKIRQLLQHKWKSGEFVLVSFPPTDPTFPCFGHAKDDPNHEEYLEEIRRFREEMDKESQKNYGSGPCSNSSSTPTT